MIEDLMSSSLSGDHQSCAAGSIRLHVRVLRSYQRLIAGTVVCATGAVHSDIFRSIKYRPNPVTSRKTMAWLMVAERRCEYSHRIGTCSQLTHSGPSHSLQGSRGLTTGKLKRRTQFRTPRTSRKNTGLVYRVARSLVRDARVELDPRVPGPQPSLLRPHSSSARSAQSSLSCNRQADAALRVGRHRLACRWAFPECNRPHQRPNARRLRD